MNTAITFGADNHLVGIVSRPERVPERTSDARVPGVLFVNAGIDHRVGPRRLYVAFSRWLVDAGYPTIRFDYGGLGESRKSDAGTSAQSECAAAATCMSELAGCERIVVCGLCSGAHDAYRLAVQDERVAGLILIDGYAYPTLRFRMTYYLQRLLSPRRWHNLFRRLPMKLGFRRGHTGIDAYGIDLNDVAFFDRPSRNELAEDLRGLVARDVKLFFAYSGGARDEYNYKSQFRDTFPDIAFGDCLQEHFMPEADHTISRASDRHELMLRLRAWLDECVTPAIEKGINRKSAP